MLFLLTDKNQSTRYFLLVLAFYAKDFGLNEITIEPLEHGSITDEVQIFFCQEIQAKLFSSFKDFIPP